MHGARFSDERRPRYRVPRPLPENVVQHDGRADGACTVMNCMSHNSKRSVPRMWGRETYFLATPATRGHQPSPIDPATQSPGGGKKKKAGALTGNRARTTNIAACRNVGHSSCETKNGYAARKTKRRLESVPPHLRPGR